jgi:predicted deacylase
VEEDAVRMHLAGLDAVLRLLGMVDGQDAGPAPGEHRYLRRFLWLRCRDAGWWEPTVRPGDAVAAGQAIGTVTSLDGAQVLETITAPSDAVVMFLTSSPAVAADGLLIGLGAS